MVVEGRYSCGRPSTLHKSIDFQNNNHITLTSDQHGVRGCRELPICDGGRNWGRAWGTHAAFCARGEPGPLLEIFDQDEETDQTQGVSGLSKRDIALVVEGGYNTVESVAYT